MEEKYRKILSGFYKALGKQEQKKANPISHDTMMEITKNILDAQKLRYKAAHGYGKNPIDEIICPSGNTREPDFEISFDSGDELLIEIECSDGWSTDETIKQLKDLCDAAIRDSKYFTIVVPGEVVNQAKNLYRANEINIDDKQIFVVGMKH